MPGVIWLVLFGGAVVAIVFTFFFGTQNLRAQIVMTALLAIVIFAELLIIVAIDRPFTGIGQGAADAAGHRACRFCNRAAARIERNPRSESCPTAALRACPARSGAAV